MTRKPVIVWFRRDLRLADHRALCAALATGSPVLPVYVLDDDAGGSWKMGAASRWWLEGSLSSLSRDLSDLDSNLVLRRGPTLTVLASIAQEAGAQTVFCTRCYEPWEARLELVLKFALADLKIELKRFAGGLLREPEELRTQVGTPFKVYTPFWRSVVSKGPPAIPVPAPNRLPNIAKQLSSDALSDWNLLPSRSDWAGGFRETWQPGERGAHSRLQTFLKSALAAYTHDRNRPDLAGTSRLSPHLHFGEISPHACWHAADAVAARDPRAGKGLATFHKELVWREFAHHLLVHWPTLPDAPFRSEFAHYPWRGDQAMLAAWQRGRTGYPIVDAGMRELWHTGWMHNRVRMIVASFLIKHLLVSWQEGEAWFWDTLVDADLAANAASWQWVAGSGADAAPYFRIFNPVTQGEKFDPEGHYVRRWVPELSRLETRDLHAPWLASERALSAGGVELGRTYPNPIIDHAKARVQALAGYEAVKAAHGSASHVS